MSVLTLPTTVKSWQMFAQRVSDGSYVHFGPKGYAEIAVGDGAFRVELAEDRTGEYFAWIPDGGMKPLYVVRSLDELAWTYSLDEPIDIFADMRDGLGRIVRLAVRELEPAY